MQLTSLHRRAVIDACVRAIVFPSVGIGSEQYAGTEILHTSHLDRFLIWCRMGNTCLVKPSGGSSWRACVRKSAVPLDHSTDERRCCVVAAIMVKQVLESDACMLIVHLPISQSYCSGQASVPSCVLWPSVGTCQFQLCTCSSCTATTRGMPQQVSHLC
jgi:hypothetical protein